MSDAVTALAPATATLAQAATAARQNRTLQDAANFARLLDERTADTTGTTAAGEPATDAATDRRAGQEEQLREAAQGLEALLVNQMFSAMRKTVPKDEMMDGGMGEEIFRGMLDQEYATQLSQKGELGLGEIIFRQMRQYIA
ncbi:MAG TPA: rod-binding protein [bacterium]|nr:rod-binding protein [bacterium]